MHYDTASNTHTCLSRHLDYWCKLHTLVSSNERRSQYGCKLMHAAPSNTLRGCLHSLICALNASLFICAHCSTITCTQAHYYCNELDIYGVLCMSTVEHRASSITLSTQRNSCDKDHVQVSAGTLFSYCIYSYT